jgi:hypothetical protein
MAYIILRDNCKAKWEGKGEEFEKELKEFSRSRLPGKLLIISASAALLSLRLSIGWKEKTAVRLDAAWLIFSFRFVSSSCQASQDLTGLKWLQSYRRPLLARSKNMVGRISLLCPILA